MDIFTKKTRSHIMASIKSKNTSPEIKIFKELKRKGIYFQKHYKRACGSPDIAIPHKKIAIFIDGDFWHGFRYPIWRERLNSNFWNNKIENNRIRDKRNHSKLRRSGWKVLRVWEHDIENNMDDTINKIITFINE